MECIITNNPEVALILIPWFIPFDMTREGIYLELRERLENNPDETFVCLIIEGESIKGMACGYCRYKDVFIWQARKLVDLSSKFVDKAFEKIKEWAKNKGYKLISAVPRKKWMVYFRRWGFKKSVNNEIILEI